MKNLYGVLNLNEHCTSQDIRKSYKSLVLIYHPDKNSEKLHYNDLKFKEITEAYSILSNETKKKKYDNTRRLDNIDKTTQNYDNVGLDEKYDNIFNNFFDSEINSNIFNSFEKKDKNNIDIIKNIEITLEEAYNGSNCNIRIKYMVVCHCKIYKSNNKVCIFCKDSGFIKVLKQINENEISEIYEKCEKCNINTCKICNNTKYISKQKNIKVNIPKYTKNNDKIVIKNGGNQDLENGNFGNLYVYIKLLNNKLYKFVNNNIILKKHIHLYDILMKTNIIFDFLDKKKYNFELTKIINPYTNIIIKGWGLSNHNNCFGDLIIRFYIKFPKDVNCNSIESLLSKIKKSKYKFEESNTIDESLIIYSKSKNIF